MTNEQLETTLQRVLHNEVPAMIFAQTQTIRDDLATIKQVQSDQGTELRALRSDMTFVKRATREQAVLLEDLESRFTTVTKEGA